MPSGIVDLYNNEVGGSFVSGYQPLTVGAPNSNLAPITQRFRSNNAAKGFGAKPQLNFSEVIIKRVILNCED